ncbi:hypothetical protein [Pseudomonas sp. Pseu.R1]|uniref:hypothetical protein n=1 Tax=Pseudomonas sp. Pseu.R1 TaxID=3379818 RepID=UPI003B9321A2
MLPLSTGRNGQTQEKGDFSDGWLPEIPQRTAHWVLQRPDHAFNRLERWLLACPMYPALNRANVTPHTEPIAHLDETGIVAARGQHDGDLSAVQLQLLLADPVTEAR